MMVPSPTKGDEMRASDQIKEHRSYVVQHSNDGFKVKGSHWAVGYTEQYCATPLEALDAAIAAKEKEALQVNADLIELHDLRATIEAGVE